MVRIVKVPVAQRVDVRGAEHGPTWLPAPRMDAQRLCITRAHVVMRGGDSGGGMAPESFS